MNRFLLYLYAVSVGALAIALLSSVFGWNPFRWWKAVNIKIRCLDSLGRDLAIKKLGKLREKNT